jgi:tRNA pseudouridine38-40 synthase
MPRYKLTVAYDGTDFHGWQKQLREDGPLRTVQGDLEEAVRKIVREPIILMGASRTDSGVHARGQVAAFTTALELDAERMILAINSRLPADVMVVCAETVDLDFNPIGDATSKGYRYRLAHGPRRPLFDRRITSHCPTTLDVDAMSRAAGDLVGEHDFTSFARKHHGRESTVRTVYACSVAAIQEDRLRIDVSGNGFLYNMVRIIAGTLVEVGRGRVAPDGIPAILAARDRQAAGPTLPPEGLCLHWIRYE